MFPGLRSIAGHNLIDPLSLSVPDPFYLTFLREPIARVFSHYQDSVRCGNRRTFEEELRRRDQLENLQVKMIAGVGNLDKAKRCLEKFNFVGLTEEFELSLQILERLGTHPLNLSYKRRRVAPNNRIRGILGSQQPIGRNGQGVRHQLDLELYAFAVVEIFPKFCAQTGLGIVDEVPSHDQYTNEIKWKYLLNHLYNMLFYRQICKVRHKLSDCGRNTPARHLANK